MGFLEREAEGPATRSCPPPEGVPPRLAAPAPGAPAASLTSLICDTEVAPQGGTLTSGDPPQLLSPGAPSATQTGLQDSLLFLPVAWEAALACQRAQPGAITQPEARALGSAAAPPSWEPEWCPGQEQGWGHASLL